MQIINESPFKSGGGGMENKVKAVATSCAENLAKFGMVLYMSYCLVPSLFGNAS